MICLSKVVKSISVVDDRPPVKKTFADAVEMELPKMTVIKRRLFDYRENPYADETLTLPDKQGYLDELNRVKCEIAQAKAELRSLGRQVGEAIEEIENKAPDDTTSHHTLLAQAEAERLLAETRENIQNMMAGYEEEGRKMAEEARNKGYLEGFDTGFAQSLSEFKEQNNHKVQELENLLEQISAYHEEMVAQNEKDLMQLVITVCEKIIGHEIKNDPRAVVSMLYQTLDQNRREESIRITVSEDLMPAEAKASAEIKKIITQTAPNALIYVDEEAGDGTCVVETDKGITDLSVRTQLLNIADMLRDG